MPPSIPCMRRYRTRTKRCPKRQNTARTAVPELGLARPAGNGEPDASAISVCGSLLTRRAQGVGVRAPSPPCAADPASVFTSFRRNWKRSSRNLPDDAAVHLQEVADTRRGRNARSACFAARPATRVVVQADVEDRVHHARHGHLRPRPNGEEQERRPGVAEAFSGAGARAAVHGLSPRLPRRPAGHFATESRRAAPTSCRDRESRGHRNPERRHFVKTGPLRPEKTQTKRPGPALRQADTAGSRPCNFVPSWWKCAMPLDGVCDFAEQT